MCVRISTYQKKKITKQFETIKLVLFGLLMILSSVAFGQRGRALDVGVMAGGTYYMGDLNQSRHFYSPHLNLGGIVKYHFNPRIILRAGGFYSRISARDSDFSNAFQQQRDLEFETSLIELSAQVEFNFLPFIVGQPRRHGFTPYLQTGLVLYVANESHDFLSFALPVGIGVKKNIGPRLIVGAEWAFRRTFSDQLDNYTGEDISQYSTSFSTPTFEVDWHKQYSFKYTNDWYVYAALTLSYAFRLGGLGCPAYYDVY